MLQVKQMRPEDFSFATELANTMDWNMAPEDFQFMTQLEPEGCLVLFEDSTPIRYCHVHQLWQSRLVWQPYRKRRIRMKRCRKSCL